MLNQVYLVGALLLVCGLHSSLGDVVACDEHHPIKVEGAVVKMTKEVVLNEQRNIKSFGVTPFNNVTAGDCSVLGDEYIHIHECVEPYANGAITLKYNIELTPSDAGQSVTIYCIQVIDEVLDNEGGDVILQGGGVGFDFVDVIVKSQVGKGLSFTIEIFTTTA